MKYLLILLLLSGCATQQPQIIDIPKVQPSADIMFDCEDFIYPKNGSYDELKVILIQNKGVYEQCNKQNLSKKEFILNSLK